MQMGVLGKHVVSTHNIIHNAVFQPSNYSPNFKSDSKSGSFVPRASDHGRPLSVRAPDIEVRASKIVEEDPGTSEGKIVGSEGNGVPIG
jgi:hypothetical protein